METASTFITRPAKKQRLAGGKLSSSFSSSVHKEPSMKCPATSADFCALRPLLQQFIVVGSPFACDKDVSLCSLVQKATAVLNTATTSSAIQTNHIDPMSCKRLHGMLLMHLGFNMSTISTSDNDVINNNDKEKQETSVLLLQCLRSLYGVLATGTALPAVDQEDVQESFYLILQIVLESSMDQKQQINDDYISNTNESDDLVAIPPSSRPPQQLWRACWQVLDWILLSGKALEHMKELEKFQIAIEKLVMNLLHCIGHDSTKMQEREYAMALLRKLYKNPSMGKAVGHKAAIALSAISKQPTLAMDENTNSDNEDDNDSESLISQRRERVFHWKCLALCSTSFNPLSVPENNNKSPVQELLEMAVPDDGVDSDYTLDEKKLAVDAVECLCLFSRKIHQVEDYPGSIVDALIHVVMSESKELRRLALPGLVDLLNHDYGMQAFLERGQATKLLLSLSSSSLYEETIECNTNSALTYVAKLITRTIAYAVDHILTGKEYIELWATLLSSLVNMLTSDEQLVLRLAVDGICLVCETSNSLRRYALNTHPELVSALAHVALNDFTPHHVRHKIMKIYTNILKGPNNPHVAVMARESKVMEALVQIAALQTMSPMWEESRKLALSIILKLSTNVCNRRILAKQTGLLSTLIRHARNQGNRDINIDDGNSEIDSLLTKEELKKQILVLASAL